MIDKQETAQKISAIVAEKLSIDKSTITPESTLQDLGADSLDMVEIIMQIEEEFGIQINDEEAEKLNTMAEVVDYVHERRKS
ncbi:MAG TPA: acyl carrier protein [Candidatus Babeliales bacterium]|jgi:acyl carrier protein|nr:acyl carrier protein [Candidatus Babeliales bacterium]